MRDSSWINILIEWLANGRITDYVGIGGWNCMTCLDKITTYAWHFATMTDAIKMPLNAGILTFPVYGDWTHTAVFGGLCALNYGYLTSTYVNTATN